METSGVARRLSSRFVAGETLAKALDVSRRVNADGLFITLDHLGENVTSLPEAEAFRDEYIQALSEIEEHGIDGNVSLKLTQFGMELDEGACRRNVEAVVRKAAELKSFVRVDMESSSYTDRTLAIVRGLHSEYGSVGAVIQAYLFRSEKDIECLNLQGIRVRLCKGAYLEPPEVAFERTSDVDANFVKLAQRMLEEGTYPAFATHDERMIDAARGYARKKNIEPTRYEFQMLYGIRRDLQRKLIAEGYRVRLYVPYGKAWYPYFMRRLAERPANLWFLARNLFE